MKASQLTNQINRMVAMSGTDFEICIGDADHEVITFRIERNNLILETHED